MDSQGRVLAIAIVVVSLGVVALWLRPTVVERLAPEPVRAWVAIEPEGAGVADIGPVFLAAGQNFKLHAVLEAVDRSGASVFYTRAPALRFVAATTPVGLGSPIAGSEAARLEVEPIPASALRTWDRGPHVKVRWFTIEGSVVYLPLGPGVGVDTFTLEPFFQVDWTSTWSIPGEIEGLLGDHRRSDTRELSFGRTFGTQRYHVRVELYNNDESTLPVVKIPSGAVDELMAEPSRFPTVVASLPGALSGPSKLFGLTQIEMPPSAEAGELARLRVLAEQGLVFSRLTMLRDQLQLESSTSATASAPSRWVTIDLGADQAWGDAVAPGDLLRVGERVVVLYEDRGVAGRLDYDDLCFDFVRGAAIRALGDVFSGEGLVVELHRVGTPEPS